MPHAAPRPCNHKGCPDTVRGRARFCNRHKADELEAKRGRDQRRGTAASRGYGGRWQRERAAYLAANPICCDPSDLHEHQTKPSTVVDHKIPHRGNLKAFWNADNWQPLCKPCHDAKTAGGQ